MRLAIAEDSGLFRSSLTLLLEASGAQVTASTPSGAELLAAIGTSPPDVVILDIRMPRLDGIAATAYIKQRWPQIRVIAHSLADELRGEALAAGADAFVAKGSPPGDLLKALYACDGSL